MKTILLIDDDKFFANVYRNRLSLDGFEVKVAPDGEQGLELLQSARPDAVILDLILPNMHGLEVIKEIRSRPDLKKLPIFVFTNSYLTGTVWRPLSGLPEPCR